MNPITLNRLANCHNQYQGKMKRVLAVCSAGLLRAPSIAFVLSNPPFNFNTRAVGATQEYALIPIDRVLVEWADEIVCAENEQVRVVKEIMEECDNNRKPIHCLDLPDQYQTRGPELIKIITEKAKAIYGIN